MLIFDQKCYYQMILNCQFWGMVMIRLLIKKLLDDKSFKDKEKITLNQVAQDTGISRATLNRIVNNPGYNTNTDTINALCEYFQCSPGELMEYIPDTDEK